MSAKWASPLGGTAPAYVLEKGVSVVVDGDGNTIHLDNRGIPSFSDDLRTISNAQTAVRNTTNAIEDIAANRAEVGSAIRRIQFESEELSVLAQNLDASVSRIQDVDVAEESATFARNSILTQAGTSMLAQANLIPEIALRLLS